MGNTGINKNIQLYNLKNDISESKNVANEYPEIIEKMNINMNLNRINNKLFPFGGIDN